MSDDTTKQLEGELGADAGHAELGDQPEDTQVETQDESEQQEKTAEDGDVENTQVDIEVERQKAREGLIKQAQQLVDAGETVPKDLEWAVEHTKKTVKKQPRKEQSTLTLADVEQVAEISLNTQKLKDDVQGLGLSKTEREELAAEWQENIALHGMNKDTALHKAMRAQGLTRRMLEAEKEGVKKAGTTMPPPGNALGNKPRSDKHPKDMDAQDFMDTVGA